MVLLDQKGNSFEKVSGTVELNRSATCRRNCSYSLSQSHVFDSGSRRLALFIFAVGLFVCQIWGGTLRVLIVPVCMFLQVYLCMCKCGQLSHVWGQLRILQVNHALTVITVQYELQRRTWHRYKGRTTICVYKKKKKRKWKVLVLHPHVWLNYVKKIDAFADNYYLQLLCPRPSSLSPQRPALSPPLTTSGSEKATASLSMINFCHSSPYVCVDY